MQQHGSLRLMLVTGHGGLIGEPVRIKLRNRSVADERVIKAVATQAIVIPGLADIGAYEVEIEAARFESQRRLVEIKRGETVELVIVFLRHDDDDECRKTPSLPAPKIHDQLDQPALTSQMAMRLAGAPADGASTPSQAAPKVIWVENGDEVLVHLDSMRIRIMDGIVLVSIDLETDQTGRTPLVVSLAMGRENDPAGLVAVTDEFPRGNGLLASRWGRALQAAAWASLLGIAKDHATERASSPLGIAAAAGRLSLTAGAAIKVSR